MRYSNVIDELWVKNNAIALSISAIAFCGTHGDITYVNKSFLSLWGYDDEAEVVGRNASSFWSTDGYSGAAGRTLTEKGGWIGEIHAFNKNGVEFPVQISISLLTEANKQAVRYVASFINITERVAAQREQAIALHHLSERVKELDCILSITACQRQQSISLEVLLKELTSLVQSSMQWPDRACVRIAVGSIDVRTDNFIESDSMYRLLLQCDPKGSMDIGYTTGDDNRRILKEEKNLFTAVAHEIESIIEQYRLENELRISHERLLHADKLVSIGVLSAGIIHEIGNPNNFIAINARLLTKVWKSISPILESYFEENGTYSVAGIPYDEARKEIPKLIDGILEGSDRIRSIGTRLKTFVNSYPQPEHEEIDINLLVSHAILFVRNVINESTKRFSLNLGTSLPLVAGDPVQIEQVIINLVTNACQALRGDDGVVTITTTTDEKCRSVTITVEDSGVGIDAKYLSRLTDPFYSTRRDFGGTGLGLSVSNHIVLQHNGTMTFTSTPHKGTAVHVTFLGVEKHE